MSQRSGQSLIDVLIASALGAILLVGALSVLAPALRGSSAAEDAQDGSAAARGLLDGVRSLAAHDWDAVASLTPGSPYHLTYSSTSTSVAAGTDTALASSTGVIRSFSVSPVRRNSTGSYVPSGGYVDSSTLALSVSYRVPPSTAKTMSTFLVRAAGSQAAVQTDWSGGDGETAASTSLSNTFASSTGVDVSTTTGSIVLDSLFD